MSSEPGGERWVAVQRDIEQVTRATERASRLTHQLLAFARREVVQPRVISLNGVVTETEQLLRHTIGEHVELVTDLEPDLWPIVADPGRIEQVLVNLAVNAHDAMSLGGTLEIETRNIDADTASSGSHPGLEPGRYVRIRVGDTGTGMDLHTQHHAFDPFFSTKPKGEGTGLGLAQRCTASSPRPAGIRRSPRPAPDDLLCVAPRDLLPRRHSAPTTTPRRRPSSAAARRSWSLRTMTSSCAGRGRILTRHGHKVLFAEDGVSALEVLDTFEGEIHMLLTDVVMPELQGTELRRRGAPAPSCVACPLHVGLRVLPSSRPRGRSVPSSCCSTQAVHRLLLLASCARGVRSPSSLCQNGASGCCSWTITRCFWRSLVRLLSEQPDIEVIGVAATVNNVVRTVTREAPDVAVIDYGLPDGAAYAGAADHRDAVSGDKGHRPQRRRYRSSHASRPPAGCVGFLDKSKAFGDLTGLIRDAFAGGCRCRPCPPSCHHATSSPCTTSRSSTSRTTDVVGFEALVRWNHPQRGLVFPDEFIPLAEQTSLITEIDDHVWMQACLQAAVWSDRYPDEHARFVSVNVSGRDLGCTEPRGATQRRDPARAARSPSARRRTDRDLPR